MLVPGTEILAIPASRERLSGGEPCRIRTFELVTEILGVGHIQIHSQGESYQHSPSRGVEARAQGSFLAGAGDARAPRQAGTQLRTGNIFGPAELSQGQDVLGGPCRPAPIPVYSNLTWPTVRWAFLFP